MLLAQSSTLPVRGINRSVALFSPDGQDVCCDADCRTSLITGSGTERRWANDRSLSSFVMHPLLFSRGRKSSCRWSKLPAEVKLANGSSIFRTIRTARLSRSAWPCGKRPRCETFAETNNIAEEFGQAATQAPHPIQAAASIARSASPVRLHF